MGLFFSDKYTINHSSVAPAYPQTIHEHRAPTDDSVKLLREMEEAARQSVVGSCRIEDNTLDGVVVVFNLAATLPERIAYIRFNFNGKPIVITERLAESYVFDPATAYRALLEAVRDKILNAIEADISNALGKSFRNTTR